MNESGNGFSLPEEALKVLEGAVKTPEQKLEGAVKTPEQKLQEFESALSGGVNTVGDVIAAGKTPTVEQISQLVEAVEAVVKVLKGSSDESKQSKYQLLLSDITGILALAQKPSGDAQKDSARIQAALSRFAVAVNGSERDWSDFAKVPLTTFLGQSPDRESAPEHVKKPEAKDGASKSKKKQPSQEMGKKNQNEILQQVGRLLDGIEINVEGGNIGTQDDLTQVMNALGRLSEIADSEELKQFATRLIGEFVAVKQAIVHERFVDADRLLARAADAYDGKNEAWDSIDASPAMRLIRRSNPNYRPRFLTGELPKKVEPARPENPKPAVEETPAPKEKTSSAAVPQDRVEDAARANLKELAERRDRLFSLPAWKAFEWSVNGAAGEVLEVDGTRFTRDEFLSQVFEALTQHFPEKFATHPDPKSRKRLMQGFVAEVPQRLQEALSEVVISFFPDEKFGSFIIAKPEKPSDEGVYEHQPEKPKKEIKIESSPRPNSPEKPKETPSTPAASTAAPKPESGPQPEKPTREIRIESPTKKPKPDSERGDGLKETPAPTAAKTEEAAQATLKLRKSSEKGEKPKQLPEFEPYTKERVEKLDVNVVVADPDFMTYLTKGVQERGIEVSNETMARHYANYQTALMLSEGFVRNQLGILAEAGLTGIDSSGYAEIIERQLIAESYEDPNFYETGARKLEVLNQFQKLPALISKLEARVAEVATRGISRDLIAKIKQGEVHKKALKAGWFSGVRAFFEGVTKGGSMAKFREEIASNEAALKVTRNPAHREILEDNIKNLRLKYEKRELHAAKETVDAEFHKTNPGFFRYVLNGLTSGFAKKELRKIQERIGKLEKEKTTYERYVSDVEIQRERLAELRQGVLGSLLVFKGALPFLELAIRSKIQGSMNGSMAGLSEAAKMLQPLTVLELGAGSREAVSMRVELTRAIESQIKASIKKMLERALRPEKGKSPIEILNYALNEWVNDTALLDAGSDTKGRIRFLLEMARDDIPEAPKGEPDPGANQLKRFYLNMLIERYTK